MIEMYASIENAMRDHAAALDAARDQLHEAGWSAEDARSRFLLERREPQIAHAAGAILLDLRDRLPIDRLPVLDAINEHIIWLRPHALRGPSACFETGYGLGTTPNPGDADQG